MLDIGARPGDAVPFLAYKGVGLAGISFETNKATPTRVYVALIRAPYGLDLVDISVSPGRARDLDAWAEQAEQVLRTISLPPGVRAVA
jgi:hypothetical protein